MAAIANGVGSSAKSRRRIMPWAPLTMSGSGAPSSRSESTLTMTLVIALDASPSTRPVAILMGPELKKMPPPAQVNQPLLDADAMDKPADHTG